MYLFRIKMLQYVEGVNIEMKEMMRRPCCIHISEDARGVLALLGKAAASIDDGEKKDGAQDHGGQHHLSQARAVHHQCHRREE